MNNLFETYNKIKQFSDDIEIEDFEVVKKVHDYRYYWKPDKIKTILLAESHVFTKKEDLKKRHLVDLDDYPIGYVRFVYNLSYGQNNILWHKVENNKGTPQFWTLFNQATNGNFRVTNNSDQKDKIKQKIELLKSMKEMGIWLLDCSIVGIYDKGEKPSRELYGKILKTSFQNYCNPIIQETCPKNIVIIGKSVHDTIREFLDSEQTNIQWIHQPNARLTNDQRIGINNIKLLN